MDRAGGSRRREDLSRSPRRARSRSTWRSSGASSRSRGVPGSDIAARARDPGQEVLFIATTRSTTRRSASRRSTLERGQRALVASCRCWSRARRSACWCCTPGEPGFFDDDGAEAAAPSSPATSRSRSSTSESRSGSTTSPTTTRSPASPTARCSTSASRSTCSAAGARPAACAGPDRHRALQDDQRHARPAAGDELLKQIAAAAGRARPATSTPLRAPRRRPLRRRAPDVAVRGRRGAPRWRTAARSASARLPVARQRAARSRPRSASRCSRTTAPTPRRCSGTPRPR